MKQAARSVWRGDDPDSRLHRELVIFMADRKKVPYPAYPIRWEMFTNIHFKTGPRVSKERLGETKYEALRTVLKGGYFLDCGKITGNALHLELDCTKLVAEAAKAGVSRSLISHLSSFSVCSM
jgi:hypothetical protein